MTQANHPTVIGSARVISVPFESLAFVIVIMAEGLMFTWQAPLPNPKYRTYIFNVSSEDSVPDEEK